MGGSNRVSVSRLVVPDVLPLTAMLLRVTVIQDVSNVLEKFERLFADPGVDRNSYVYRELLISHIHISHRLRALQGVHRSTPDRTGDSLITAARLYKEPVNIQRDSALRTQKEYIWALVGDLGWVLPGCCTFRPKEGPWKEAFALLQHSTFKSWRIIQELCGIQTDQSVEYDPETDWCLAYYVEAIRIDAIAMKLPKISVSTLNRLFPAIGDWVSNSSHRRPLVVIMTALLESLVRVEWDSQAPPDGFTHLLSEYIGQLATCPAPCHVSIPWPDVIQDQDANDATNRIILELDPRITFNSVLLTLKTESNAEMATLLYESFNTLVSKLEESPPPIWTNARFKGQMDPLRETIEEIRVVYKESQEKMRSTVQAPPSTDMVLHSSGSNVPPRPLSDGRINSELDKSEGSPDEALGAHGGRKVDRNVETGPENDGAMGVAAGTGDAAATGGRLGGAESESEPAGSMV